MQGRASQGSGPQSDFTINEIELNWTDNSGGGASGLKLFAVSGVRYSSMLRVYGCVFCSVSLLSVYMCVRLPSSPRSIAGVPSSRALPGFPITAPPPVYVPAAIGALAVW